MSVPALSIKNLSKVYATGVHALKNVSLEIPAGDFFALLGPNGAGKTTLIGIVCGLVNKTSGSVHILGHDTDTHASAAKVAIGIVPQEFNFNIFEKVKNVVIDQAGYYGIPRTAAAPSAERYLRALGLWEKRNEQARNLSGGMKRRLMIARALVHNPDLLILDEPTAGVDIELRRGMWDFLRELSAGGTTIILTTHYLEEAEQLARHLAIIDKGEIVEQGSIKSLLGKLTTETFVLDLASPADTSVVSVVADIKPHLADPMTLEISIQAGQTISEALALLQSRGILVRSLRNKTNRLEELFLRLTGGSGGSGL